MDSNALLDERAHLLEDLRRSALSVQTSTNYSQQHHRGSAITNLCVLCSGNVNKCPRSRVNNVKQFQKSSTVICKSAYPSPLLTRNSRLATLVDNELVHSAGAQRRCNSLRNSQTCGNVAQQLSCALRCVGALWRLACAAAQVARLRLARTPKEDHCRLLQVSKTGRNARASTYHRRNPALHSGRRFPLRFGRWRAR